MTLSIDHIIVWVTRPERPKGAKDEIKPARRANNKKLGPLNFKCTHIFWWWYISKEISDLENSPAVYQCLDKSPNNYKISHLQHATNILNFDNCIRCC